MSLQIIAGPSGSGKSTYAYRSVIEESIRYPDRHYIIIVPDQFSMSTTREICRLHPAGGIMNIEVLSFSRLCYRISEEVGSSRRIVLDDTGKNLILRRVALSMEEQLTFLKGRMKRPGYVHEVKSQISEFYQYDISDSDLMEMIDASKDRGYLNQKLSDLRLLYKGFSDYIRDKYITTEEALSELARMIPKSGLLAGATVLFDNFTGFTPVQDKVIRQLLLCCRKVSVTLCLSEEQEEKLFSLTRKSHEKLIRLAEEAKVTVLPKVRLPQDGPVRYQDCPSLAFLEKNLLRCKAAEYRKSQEQIRIYEALDVRDEVQWCCRQICGLIRQGYEYRQIAIETGDLEGYGNLLAYELARFGIPYYMDLRRSVLQNPAVTLLRCALQIVAQDFSYDSVMGFLRSGLTDLSPDEIDRFEIFLSKCGIRRRSMYMKLFSEDGGADISAADTNGTERNAADKNGKSIPPEICKAGAYLLRILTPLCESRKTASAITEGLYDLCTEISLQEKCEASAKVFSEQGDTSMAKEYEKIYGSLMDLLDQIHALIGDDKIDIAEYLSIFEAGVSEIRIGTIPQRVDQVTVGDVQRTRLESVRFLFFIGVNDGIVPKRSMGGGIFSEVERQYLQSLVVTLSPGPREKILEEQLYLYQNVTKPAEGLFLSYATLDRSGKSVEPSFFIRHICSLFPSLSIESAPDSEAGKISEIATKEDGLQLFAALLSEQAQQSRSSGGHLSDGLIALCSAYGDTGMARDLIRSSIWVYQPKSLDDKAVSAIYKKGGTITRLEKMAACPFAHFLQYGLGLREKEAYEVDVRDLGNVYHEVLLEVFSKCAAEENGFALLTVEEIEKLANEKTVQAAESYRNQVMTSGFRNAYKVKQMINVLSRSMKFMSYHLSKGKFVPLRFEFPFEAEKSSRIHGIIDRIDVAREGDKTYVKIVDYKSGDRKLDISKLYYGVSIQLPIYMAHAVRLLEKEEPGRKVIAAAMLYFILQNPVVEASDDITAALTMAKQMRATGLFTDANGVIDLLDDQFQTEGKSDVVHAERKSDGSLYAARSEAVSEEEMNRILTYAQKKAENLLSQIDKGDIAIAPFEIGNKDFDSCQYCGFKGICGFDERIAGFEKKRCPKVQLDDLK